MRKLFLPPCVSMLVQLSLFPSATGQTTALPAPWFGPAGGTYTYNLTVAINESVPNMTMFYTTDGSTPSATHGTEYEGAIPVTANVTIKAIAVDKNSPARYANSPVSTASYVLNQPNESPLPQGEWAWESGQDIYDDRSNPLDVGCPYWASGVLGEFGSVGVPSDTNQPGSHMASVHWTDKKGNLWLFGGLMEGQFCVQGNDLWMFDVATRQWTWMSGSGGQLYSYGPVVYGNDSGTYPSPNVNGVTNVAGQGVYGVQGQFAAGNTPGAGRARSAGLTRAAICGSSAATASMRPTPQDC